MLSIKRVLADGTCVFCDKEKEVASVSIDGQGSAEIPLCWADVRKMAHMQMRMNGNHSPAPNEAAPVAEVIADPDS